ncbi:fimbrial protein [Dyella sp. GSA-30]|uniref:fimbrial protein n=1 Tax=Dyella sp. GSA-30 TaxID=2994496 RepID=UPI002491D5EC|nr:fimbrial protein [Dyella sp. GSA-30]BDU23188.1 fimbrial protein [Dyella sp. GSA-30]
MNLKLLSSALLAAALAAPSAFAADGIITFNGAITTTSCLINGAAPGAPASSFTVTMPTVNTSSMPNISDTAGATGFRIRIGGAGDTNCTNGTRVYAHFEPGPTVDPTTGSLILQGTGAAAGVQIELANKLGSKIDIFNDQDSSQIKEVVANNEATLAYISRYVRTGAVTAGPANSSVMYTVSYEAAPSP